MHDSDGNQYEVIDQTRNCMFKRVYDPVNVVTFHGPSTIKVGDVEYTVTEIGENSFGAVSVVPRIGRKLIEVAGFDMVKKIRPFAFHSCVSLTKIPRFDNVTEIAVSAFSYVSYGDVLEKLTDQVNDLKDRIAKKNKVI
jgi:hypothetical protein